MDKFLYRAKRKDNGEWIEGYHVKIQDYLSREYIHVIIPEDATLYPHGEFDEHYEVIRETIGRLLGHADYDGFCEVNKLYQNDIIGVWERHEDIDRTPPSAIALVLDEHSISENGYGRWFPQDTTRIRIIGNAYDNPELLRGHDARRFVNSFNNYHGTSDEYSKEHRYLTDKYNIHGAHACCYMCNYENYYLCYQWNGGCPRIDTCRDIYKHEGMRF